MSKILIVTGGFGFIGKHFVRRCLSEGHHVINIDKESYAADRLVSEEFKKFPSYRHIKLDINEIEYLPECDAIINFAAESHVDNAITSNQKFCQTNIMGVQTLLEFCRRKQPFEKPHFIQISTDEVYGDVMSGEVNEQAPLLPSNPYSATKAAADMLIMSWGRTYGVPFSIIRPTNNYGMHQYPEKLIPKSCFRMRRGKPALLHGDGSYRRCWLHAEDTVDAIFTVLEKGVENEIYNASGDLELKNIDVVKKIASILKVPEEKAWIFIDDRSGQDIRYSVDDAKLKKLGWRPKRNFDAELETIVSEYQPERFL